ncbi:MAG: putative lipopolysaccharide heptosyltransferase III [Magnetococcus sp. DMHC-1]
MKILLINLKHLGDTLLCTPTIAALRQRYPAARIDVVVRSGCGALLQGNPDLTHLVEIAHMEQARRTWRGSLAEWRRLLGVVLGQRYDFAFDLSNSDRSKVIMLLACARVRAMNIWSQPPHWKHRLCNRFSTFPWGRAHHVLRDYHTVMDVVAPGEMVAGPGPMVVQVAEDRRAVQARIPDFAWSRPYVVVHPTSRWRFKQWLPERWGEMIDWVQEELGWGVILSSGPAPKEQADIKTILASCRTQPTVLSGFLTLPELAQVLAGCRLFLGVDTMAMHLAAAVQVPVVALFGPSAEWVWGPWHCRHELVVGACSCKQNGYYVCDKSRPYPCMASVTTNQVQEKVRTLLQCT